MEGQKYTTQNSLLLNNLMKFYDKDNNLEKVLPKNFSQYICLMILMGAKKDLKCI